MVSLAKFPFFFKDYDLLEVNKIKITLTRWYRKEGRSYPAGMVLDITPEDFNPAFMAIVQEPVPVETVKKEVVTAEPEAPKIEDSPPKSAAKPRKVKK